MFEFAFTKSSGPKRMGRVCILRFLQMPLTHRGAALFYRLSPSFATFGYVVSAGKNFVPWFLQHRRGTCCQRESIFFPEATLDGDEGIMCVLWTFLKIHICNTETELNRKRQVPNTTKNAIFLAHILHISQSFLRIFWVLVSVYSLPSVLEF